MRKSKLAKSTLLVWGLCMVFGLQTAVGQCLFNCNDTVHVSVNNMCMATITPDIVLEGVDTIPPGCVYGIELFDENGTKIATAPKLGAQYIGQTIKVRLFEKGASPANSCWAYILLEDKLPPEIICPPNDTIPCYDDENALDEAKLRAHLKSKIESNLIDNCGNEDISINIISNDLDRNCNGPFSAVQIVVYDALDRSLNATRCVDTIYYERAPFDDVDPPKNYKDNMVLKCYGSWDKDGDGLPSAEELMLLDGDKSIPNINGKDIRDFLLCNFKLTHQDVYYPDCGNTFKIVRRWTVIDWCNANHPKFFYQIIKVVDDRINATFPDDIDDVVANPWTCDGQVTLPAPEVSEDECSDWTWSIMVREPGDSGFTNFGGTRSMNTSTVSRVFPAGKSTVKYTVEDACKNIRIDSFCVIVVDEDDPVAVCDYRTVVTLNDAYLGKVFANSFDDGSFDGCSGISEYKVRRIDRFTTGCETPGDYDDFVKFCCEDLGKTIMIELRVKDGTGRISICMAEAVVQFKGPGPNIVCPPDPGVQDCRTYENFNIGSLQKPQVSSTNPCLQGNLGTTVRETGRDLDECGNGYIDVEWFVNFNGTEQVICNERVDFSNLDPFDKFDINWPSDKTLNSCEGLEPTAAEENNLFDADRPCSNIFGTHEDEVFDNVSGFCRKVLRTWTVIDWCQFNSSTTNYKGIWTHVQKIHIIQSDAPQFGLIAGAIDIQDDQNNCRAQVRATGQATDDCTETNKLSWTHKLDVLFGNTTIPVIAKSPGNLFQRNLDVGTYLITWEVTDHCGNTTSKTQSFEVSDSQNPTAICRSGGGNLNLNTGQLVVHAEDLNGGSDDNCDANLEYTVRRAGSASTPTATLTFGCNDVGVQELELRVRDNAGNSEFCTVFFEVRDDNTVCGALGASIQVAGMVRTVDDDPIEEAVVHMEDPEMSTDQKQMTPYTGEYAFNEIVQAHDYTVYPSKKDDYANGVSTIDLILIQMHILGTRPFDSPYKYIAGDASNDRRISSIDLVLLRRLILGQIATLPNNDSWRFIPKGHVFDNPTYPWPFEEAIRLTNVVEDHMKNDFTGIKIGDLDQNAVANSRASGPRSHQSKILHIAAQAVNSDEYRFSVRVAEEQTLNGFQIALNYDPDELEFVRIEGDQLDVGEEHFVSHQNVVRISWTNPEGQQVGEDASLYDLIFRKINDRSKPRSLQLETWQNEWYDGSLNTYKIELEESIQMPEEVALYQNRPNPFSKETTIEFYLPQAGEAQMEIFDLNGKKVFDHGGWFEIGVNQVTVHRNTAGLNRGIYYYQLTTSRGTVARKMIVM